MIRTTPPWGRISDLAGSCSAVILKFFIVFPQAPKVMPCPCSISSVCWSAGSIEPCTNCFNAGPNTTSSRDSIFCHPPTPRSEEHTSELQSLAYLVCRLLLEKKKKKLNINIARNERRKVKIY